MPRLGPTPGLHAICYPRKNGPDAWYATGSLIDKKKVRLRGVTSREEADRELSRLYARIVGGDALVRLAEAVDAYTAELDKLVAIGQIVPSTRNHRVRAAERIAKLLGGNRLLRELTVRDLWRVRNECLERASKPSSARKSIGLARQAVATWRKQGLLSLTKDEVHDSLELVRVRQDGPVWLRKDEIAEVLARAGDDPRPRLLLLTGMRKGELHRLRWETGVDLDEQVVRHVYGSQTKKSRTVDLRIIPSVEAWLRERQQASGPVFPGRPLGLNRSLARLFVERLRSAVPGLKPKDLRSTCATYLHCAYGIPLTVHQKARQLGHSIAVAESRYAGLTRTVDPEARTLEQAMGIEPL